MLYTEALFLLLFAVVVVVGRLLRPWPVAREWWLIAFSLLVIASWGLVDLGLFLGVLVFNHFMIGAMAKSPPRIAKRFLFAAIAADLATLALFKYANFIGDNLRLAVGIRLPHFPLGIPLAISFYTFHIISYMVDVYKGRVRTTSFRHYLFYLSFFPHVVAGPIVRVWQLVPQIGRVRRIRTDMMMGFHFIVVGFFLKTVSANHIAQFLDPLWGISSSVCSTLDRWLCAFLFYCQIYGDFAGYTLMALGMSRMLGYRLPVNFRSPMLATSIQDFWRRWHITLSQWLRDYLYIPMGGNRRGPFLAAVYVLVTMLLGGLWHGAGWGFIIWGAMHGIAIVAGRLLKPLAPHSPLPGWMLAQAWILLTWVFFRTPDASRAWELVRQMIVPNPKHCLSIHPQLAFTLLFAIPVLLHHAAPWAIRTMGRRRLPVFLGTITGSLLIADIVVYAPVKTFIYFKF